MEFWGQGDTRETQQQASGIALWKAESYSQASRQELTILWLTGLWHFLETQEPSDQKPNHPVPHTQQGDTHQ